MIARICLVVVLVFSLVRTAADAAGPGALFTPLADPFPSTYAPALSRTTLIRNATILTAASSTIRGGSILVQNGKILAVGTHVAAQPDALVIDGSGDPFEFATRVEHVFVEGRELDGRTRQDLLTERCRALPPAKKSP